MFEMVHLLIRRSKGAEETYSLTQEFFRNPAAITDLIQL